MAEESKHDILLRRVQIILGVLVGITGLIVGVYNVRKIMKPEPPPPPPVSVQQPAPGGEIRSALEEASASWIRKLGKVKED